MRAAAVAAVVGAAVAAPDAGLWKIREDDPLSIERFAYWGCNADGGADSDPHECANG